MIDRYLLRYFLAVLDCGNFSKAAKKMNVAQPTLSVGISKLERLLGTPLFQRSSKQVRLTDAGLRFAVHARRIENEFNLAAAEVLDVKPVRAIRLGAISTFPTMILGDAIRAAKRATTTERLQVVVGDESELLHRLDRGQVDVALSVVRQNVDRFACEPLFTEGYELAIPAAHPLAAKKTVVAEDLAETPAILRRHCEAASETGRYFIERGIRPFFAFRSTNDEQVLLLISAGLGIAVMPACYAMKGVVRRPVQGFDVRREIGLLYAVHAEHLRHNGSAMLQAIRARCTRMKSSRSARL